MGEAGQGSGGLEMPHTSDRLESLGVAAPARVERGRTSKKKKKGRRFGQATIAQLRDFARGRRAKVGNRPVRSVPPTAQPIAAPSRLRQFALGRRFR